MTRRPRPLKRTETPIDKRKTYDWWKEIYQFFVLEEHTPKEKLDKIHNIRVLKGGYKYGWTYRYSEESKDQVLKDMEQNIKNKVEQNNQNMNQSICSDTTKVINNNKHGIDKGTEINDKI
jgi:gas vesicle protein